MLAVAVIVIVKITSALPEATFQGLTKTQMGARFNRKISDEEWEMMTQSGPVIGGSDSGTAIQTESH
ncbi:hypothetical protein O6R05_08175 [Peptoniphilus equinus]|uniref:Uncharacterized protein n=1 Tax=Peptoniphilus equinus TaxID=3016343 RepID=A0ABY7QT46_9FIRM|nr:hypothetical protein [Peptoniphilus equinus]WBW49968.1 hypothetical protein O6R05_08175 [Peptoniphilus equinus]